MPISSIDLIILVLASTAALVFLAWAIIASFIIYRQRHRADTLEKEKIFQRGERKYSELFNNISDIVFVHSLDGTIQQINAAAMRELGYPVGTLLGMSLYDLVPHSPEDTEALDQYLRNTITEGQAKGLVTFLSTNGNAKIFEYRSNLAESPHGPVAIEGIARNVTEQYQAELALRNSEENYRRFFEEDLTADFVASPDGKIINCNPAFARIFGFDSILEAMQQNLASLYPSQSDYSEFLDTLTSKKKLIYHEVELRHKLAKPVYVIQNVSGVFSDDGTLIELRGYAFDNTEPKKLKDQMLHIQKMQSIGTLAGGIAHDFNNILGIILGHVSLLRPTNEKTFKVSDSIKAIQQAVSRGAGLVDQILTFARKGETKFKPLLLNQVVRDLTTMLKGTFPKTVLFELNLAGQLPPLKGDQNQLHQIFLNLFVNARDAMPQGGTIHITSGLLSYEETVKVYPEARQREYIHVEVRDTGTGMDQETMQRLFEPFFTTKEHGKGTGLGLAVVYGIIRNHSGHINLVSAPGEGTSFHLYFPISEEALATRSQKAGVSPIQGNETILIVEDEEMLINLLVGTFTKYGYKTLVANDGEQAISVFSENRDQIDLIFIDAGLPKKSGWQAYQEIQHIDPDAMVVFTSGYFDPKLKQQMEHAGITDFIQKPYSPRKIIAQIRAILDRKPQLQKQHSG